MKKKYPLSTVAERTIGIVFSALMIAVMVLLLYTLRNELPVLLVSSVGIGIIVFILILYVVNVSRAVIVFDPDNNVLIVNGFRERVIDLNKVSSLQTITVKSGHVQSRSLAFSDAEGDVIAIVPTYFTSNRGMRAEPMAKQMAAELGIQFQATVPEWEYDKEARKAHEIEVERQRKEDSKKRREAKMKMRQQKIRARVDEIRNENNK